MRLQIKKVWIVCVTLSIVPGSLAHRMHSINASLWTIIFFLIIRYFSDLQGSSLR